MKPIFDHSFKRLLPQVLGWGLGLALYCAVVISFFHIVSDNANEIQKLIESLPKALTSLIGDLNKFNTPLGYMSIRIFGIFPLILGIFGIICGSGLFIRDEERGFLDLLMGFPITRRQLFFARLGALLLAIVAILTIIWLGIIIGIYVAELQVSAWQILLIFASLFAIVFCFTTFSLMLSMILASRIAATMTAGLAMIITQMISNLAKLSSTLQPLAVISPFEYYQGIKALEGFNVGNFLLLLIAAVFFTAVSYKRFLYRDIRVAGEGDMNWKRFVLATVATLVIFITTLISLTRDYSQATPQKCFQTLTKSIENKDWKTMCKCITPQAKERLCANVLLRFLIMTLDLGEDGAIRLWKSSDDRFSMVDVEQQKIMNSLIQLQIAAANVDVKKLQQNLDIVAEYTKKMYLTTEETTRLANTITNKDSFIQGVLRAVQDMRKLESYHSLHNVKQQENFASATIITSTNHTMEISFYKTQKKWYIDLPELEIIHIEAPTVTLPTSTTKENDMGSYMLYKNISYEKKYMLLLDAYVPKKSSPVVILVHGGGWRSGNKEQMAKYGHLLADNGFACFAINYRLAPKHKYPAQLQDCLQAINWVRNNAEKYHLDIENIAAVGYSAGGHLVSLMATKSPHLKAVVAGGAPVNFSTLTDSTTTFRYVFGDIPSKMPQVYKEASPLLSASSTTPPIGFFHGERDMIVSLNSPLTPLQLHSKLQELNVDTEIEIISGVGHLEAIYHEKALTFTLRFLQKFIGEKKNE